MYCYVISRLLFHQTSFQMDRQTGCQYVNCCPLVQDRITRTWEGIINNSNKWQHAHHGTSKSPAVQSVAELRITPSRQTNHMAPQDDYLKIKRRELGISRITLNMRSCNTSKSSFISVCTSLESLRNAFMLTGRCRNSGAAWVNFTGPCFTSMANIW